MTSSIISATQPGSQTVTPVLHYFPGLFDGVGSTGQVSSGSLTGAAEMLAVTEIHPF
jgi:hypothetical protein